MDDVFKTRINHDVVNSGHFWEWLKSRDGACPAETFKPLHSIYIDVPQPAATRRSEEDRGQTEVNSVIFQL